MHDFERGAHFVSGKFVSGKILTSLAELTIKTLFTPGRGLRHEADPTPIHANRNLRITKLAKACKETT
jgi:hypothetical protein